MTIEFQCDNCQKILRTGDDKAGRTARCPQCGSSITVPDAGGDGFDEFPAGEDDFGPFDDYAGSMSAAPPVQVTCPMCGEVNESSSDRCLACGEPLGEAIAAAGGGTSTDFGDIWNRAWEVWSANLGINIAAAAIYFGITIGVNFILSFVTQILIVGVAAGGNNQGGGAAAVFFGVQLVQNVLATLLGWYLTVGFAQFAIENKRRGNPSLESLFPKGSRILPILGVMFCYTVIIGLSALPGGVLMLIGVVTADQGAVEGSLLVLFIVGLAVTLIGVLLAAILLWSVPFMLADRSSDYLASLADAFRLGRAYPGLSLVVVLVNFGLSLAGMMACCVGILFAFPLSYAVMAVAYDRCRLSMNQ